MLKSIPKVAPTLKLQIKLDQNLLKLPEGATFAFLPKTTGLSQSCDSTSILVPNSSTHTAETHTHTHTHTGPRILTFLFIRKEITTTDAVC